MSNINILVLSIILLISCTFAYSCNSSKPLTISVISPVDDTVFRTNLIKVSGSVSDFKAILTVNSENTDLTGDGHFNKFLQLKEGENTIIVEARLSKEVVKETKIVTFIPAVAVYLDTPNLNQPLTTPITVNGYVFPPQAVVQVNNDTVAVDKQGGFSAQIQLLEGNNIIKAKAILSGSEDSSQLTVLVKNGVPTIPPGQGLNYLPQWEFAQSIPIKAGQSGIDDINANIRKGIRIQIPDNYTFKAALVRSEYSLEEISLPVGMKINITPSTIDMYPNTTYMLELLIETKQNTPLGEYWILIQARNEMNGWIKVVINN